MLEKSKSYRQIKFPFGVIDEAAMLFSRTSNSKADKVLVESWKVGFTDTTWDFQDRRQFATEYEKKDLASASVTQWRLKGAKFHLNLSYYDDLPTSTLTVSMPTKEKLEKVFRVFDKAYEEYLSESRKTGSVDAAPDIPVPRYRTEKTIPSVFLEKKLLEELEEYTVRKVSQIYEGKPPKVSVIIADSLGTLSLNSIKQYKRELFDNKIRYLSLQCELATFELNILFARFRDSSTMEISYKGEDAREIVEAISAGVNKILRDNSTWNFLYSPPIVVIGILGLVLFIALTAVFAEFAARREIGQVPIATVLFLVVYVLASYLKPYTTFATKRNLAIQKWTKWLFELLLGAIIVWLLSLFLQNILLPVIAPAISSSSGLRCIDSRVAFPFSVADRLQVGKHAIETILS